MGQNAPFAVSLEVSIRELSEIIEDSRTESSSRKVALEHLVQLLRAANPANKWKTGSVMGCDPFYDENGLSECIMRFCTKQGRDRSPAEFFRNHKIEERVLERLATRMIERLRALYSIEPERC